MVRSERWFRGCWGFSRFGIASKYKEESDLEGERRFDEREREREREREKEREKERERERKRERGVSMSGCHRREG